MIGFDLSEELLSRQKAARHFAESQMKPYAAELDRRQDAAFDWDIVRRFAKANILGLMVPLEHGGSGADFMTAAIVAEELGAACMGITSVALATWVAATCLNMVGNEDQGKRYLPRLNEQQGNIAAWASTESGAGSDIIAISTLAIKEGDRYILNGSKYFITNAGLADFYIIFATTDPGKGYRGLAAFIVDGDSRGLTSRVIKDKMGLRASQIGEIFLDKVAVPVENLLGDEGAGVLILLQILDTSRPILGAAVVGLARAAFETALTYARERKQYGRAIIRHQAISFMLADMATDIDAARLLTWRASWLLCQDMDYTKASSMCKIFATEMAERVCSHSMHILGANGYTGKWPAEKYLRDVKATTISEGTNEMMRLIISSLL